MSNFEEVCLLSCENWVNSFPEKIPEHKFSKKHNQKMKELFSGEVKENGTKLSKTTIRIILIAAILLAIATTVLAVPGIRRFVTQRFSDHTEYSVVDISGAQNVISLEVNYIPYGFTKTDEFNSSDLFSFGYEKDNEFFYVDKSRLNTSINFNTENYDSENIKINGWDAVYYISEGENKGVIFNNGKYIFTVSGNIPKEELIKVAQNVE